MMTKMMCWPGRLPSPAAPSRAPLPPLIPFFRYSTLPWALFYTPLQKLSDYIMNSKVVKKKYTTVAIDPVNWRGPRIQHQTLTWTWTRAWSWNWTWTWTWTSGLQSPGPNQIFRSFQWLNQFFPKAMGFLKSSKENCCFWNPPTCFLMMTMVRRWSSLFLLT